LQTSIDSFRSKTGGNLTDMSYEYLHNATLVFQEPAKVSKRQIDFGVGGVDW
jgi:hypothetical protein